VTRVKGEVLQEKRTDDMIWSVKDTLRHLTLGPTVRAATSSGVGLFRNRFLKDSDVVEMEIKGVINESV
jgi:2-keto-4-pentenoate hydratase/2-oxohepta-3-ene-1,7-dioic acid hydratase in catechol pathway